MSESWKTLEKTKLFETPFFQLYKEKCETFSGKLMDAYYRMELDNWVQVVVETEDDEILLIRQYRHGSKEWHYEIVGGVADDGEDPLAAIKRELLEEAGYESNDWRLLAKTRPNPAVQENYMYSYLARGAKKVADQNLDPFEEIEVLTVSKNELQSMVSEGKITHCLVLMSLLMYLNEKKD